MTGATRRNGTPPVHLAAVALVLLQGCSGGRDADSSRDRIPPTVPVGLVATAQSAARIQLEWQASADTGTGVAGYRIYRDGGATPIATVTATNYQDNGLAESTTYSYTVRAFDAASPANVSAASAAASATTSAATVSGPGLDARPSNPDCLAGDAPSNAVSLATQRVFPNVGTFANPILMLQEPASSARWYVAQLGGIVYAFDNQPNIASRRVFIDVSGAIYVAGEGGLLGMAFHPDWPTNPRVYLSVTALDGGGAMVSRIVEYQSQDGGTTLASGTAKVILQFYQPEANHNGGHIAFGPDGYLYMGVGDGGSGGDPHGPIGNGQRLSTLLGKMLRIDVNGTTGPTPYAIPDGNPFKFSSGTTPNAVCNGDDGDLAQNCPEIYAYGFRNPWRWSFDTGSGELWLGDVGQSAWEEVNRIVAGGNYGWRCYEGNHDFNPDNCGPRAAHAIRPVAEYANPAFGVAVTGGYVYRGSAIPALVGRYVFGDYASGNIWHIARDTTPTLTLAGGFGSGRVISSFAQDRAGEIYLTDLANGLLYQLVPGGGGSGRVIPAQLSATGCVNPANPSQPAAGLIPFAPNAPFWSDGAVKTRWLALPDGAGIGVNVDGDFDFPNGTVLMKHFRLGTRLVETRLFVRHNDSSWAGYTYEWNQAGTDATRVVGGKTVQIDGQDWNYPSESQCLLCHTAAAGRSLGLEIAQLNGPLLYPGTGRTANQLVTLDALGMLSPPLGQPVDQLAALPDPFGLSGTLNQRARAWLHTNCAQCHRPGGPTGVDMDLRYTTPLASTNACDVVPVNALGVANARRIAIGSDAAARSLVVVRPGLTNADSMPPFQPRLVDAAGVQLLTQWVNSLASCN